MPLVKIRIVPPHGVVGREIGDVFETGEEEAASLVGQKSAEYVLDEVKPEPKAPAKAAKEEK